MMKIVQVMPTISFGDAVSNDAIAIKRALQEMNIKTNIYAENIDARLPKGIAQKYDRMPELNKNDILIYHLSTGSMLNYRVAETKARLVVRYHNVTPPAFFEGYNMQLFSLCEEGLKGAVYLSDKAEYCIADSEFNKQDLIRMGYTCEIDVLPILIAFDDYEKKPSNKIIRRYGNDDYVNVLFTGRIAPNKKQENVIAAFYQYQRLFNEKSRLFLVGSYSGTEKYYAKLNGFVEKLGVHNVHFTGHIGFDEILGYYKVADLFLCMSEHEGFCVPLPEAMTFNVPIVAYDSCAIKYTLSGSGFLLSDKDPIVVAEAMQYVLTHDELRKNILKNQRERLEDFQYEKVKQLLVKYLHEFMEKTNE